MNELHFGLCIGIDRYPGFPGRDLASATGDAKAFRDWLVAPGGGALPEANVRLVTIEANVPFAGVLDARPKSDDVVLALDDINERIRTHLAANPADWPLTRVYIYAAGHGVAIPNGEGAVLMADAKPSVLGFNVDLSLYANWYLQCGVVHEVVVFVDCCREVADGMQPGVVLFKHCAHPQNTGTVRFVGYATRYAEQALEPIADPNTERGYFTRALIDGLNGAAAETDTGQVTAASLATYVAQAVEEKTKPPVAPYPQRAEMPVDLAARLVLRDAPSGQVAAAPAAASGALTHTATIHFPAGYAGDAFVRSGDGTSHGQWHAADGAWQIQLPDSFYQVVPEPADAIPFQGEGLFALVGNNVDVQL